MLGGPEGVTEMPMVPVAAFRVASPEYWATMLLVPTWRTAAATVMLAEADDPVPLSDAAPISWPPEVKMTMPVGVAPLVPVTIAVIVTEPLDTTEVAVACKATDAAARAEEVERQPVTRLKAFTEPSPLAWS